MIFSLISCTSPFIMLFFLALASMCLSFIISGDQSVSSSSRRHHPPHSSIRSSSSSSSSKSIVSPPSSLSQTILQKQFSFLSSLSLPNTNTKILFIEIPTINLFHQEDKWNGRNRKNLSKESRKEKQTNREFTSEPKPKISKHYTCPPTSVDMLRRRYGTSSSYLGEWSISETRQFYKSQLPKALQIEGALGLSLEERARLASEARHALRLYSRERSHIVARLLAEFYDGLRHLQAFGYWSVKGMTWEEVKLKYTREAKVMLGENSTQESIDAYVYRRILERACATNIILDEMAVNGIDCKGISKILAGVDKTSENSNITTLLKDLSPLVICGGCFAPFHNLGVG